MIDKGMKTRKGMRKSGSLFMVPYSRADATPMMTAPMMTAEVATSTVTWPYAVLVFPVPAIVMTGGYSTGFHLTQQGPQKQREQCNRLFAYNL